MGADGPTCSPIPNLRPFFNVRTGVFNLRRLQTTTNGLHLKVHKISCYTIILITIIITKNINI